MSRKDLNYYGNAIEDGFGVGPANLGAPVGMLGGQVRNFVGWLFIMDGQVKRPNH